jgi:hypothetical protein
MLMCLFNLFYCKSNNFFPDAKELMYRLTYFLTLNKKYNWKQKNRHLYIIKYNKNLMR